MITFFHIMTTCTAPITATTPRAAPDQSRDRKGAGARDNQSRDRKGAGSPTNHAAACHEARRVPYLPAPTALRPGITSLRQRRYALHGPTSLRQRRYALQPRVAAQRLPWDNGPIEQVNPEGVASLTIERAVTPLGQESFIPHHPGTTIPFRSSVPQPLTAATPHHRNPHRHDPSRRDRSEPRPSGSGPTTPLLATPLPHRVDPCYDAAVGHGVFTRRQGPPIAVFLIARFTQLAGGAGCLIESVRHGC